MKRFFPLFLAAFALPAQAAEVYTLDLSHTNIYWHANHLGFSTPSGKFARVEGKVTLDEAAPEKSSVNVTVWPGSVLTGIDDFDTHLRGKDFFNAEAFPTATFESTKVTKTGENTAKVEGNFTLLGVKKPLTLDVTLNKIGIFPMNNKKTAGFTATATLKRSDFGMSYGIPAVSDEVKLTIEAEANI